MSIPQYFNQEFAPSALPVFYRTYSRGKKESWFDVCVRTIGRLDKIGNFSQEEFDLLMDTQLSLQTICSGRWLWVGGTDWRQKRENVYGAYNCNSTNIVDLESFALLMDLAMQGCGTGAVLENAYINKLPSVVRRLNVKIIGNVGAITPEHRIDKTLIDCGNDKKAPIKDVLLIVGDSRQGWTQSYLDVLKLATVKNPILADELTVEIDLGNVRPKGELLKGFGGVSNPNKLSELYGKIAKILNGAIGRKLTAKECCLIIDEAAVVVVAGNVRRSAGMRQAGVEDIEFATAKDNLWQQNSEGEWIIDPERDALRMANHTVVYHRKPTLDEIKASVTKQYYSGEGAIQWAGEAIARANADLLTSFDQKNNFLYCYEKNINAARDYLWQLTDRNIDETELNHRMSRYGLNPCGEIIGSDFFCNLSEVHLNNLNPFDLEEQKRAFRAGGLSVAALLKDKFPNTRYQYSRDIDPIVGVSFTGAFDFFVNLFGLPWLKWWEAGRKEIEEEEFINYEDFLAYSEFFPEPLIEILKEWENQEGDFELDDQLFAEGYKNDGLLFKKIEEFYLNYWRDIAHNSVWDYCDRHGLKRPNRCTTVQPAGCLDRTALRIFDQGLLYADEIINPGSGEHEGIDLSVRGGISTNKAIANEPRNLIKVTLSNGRILRMTPNHRLSINNEWVYAVHMRPGMKIDYSLGEYSKTSDASLIPIDYDRYTRKGRALEKGHNLGVLPRTIKAPSTVTPELSYFLGCLFGNGCLSVEPKRVRFSHGNVEVLRRLNEIGLNLFGIEGSLSEDVRGGRSELTFASVQLFDWMLTNGLAKDVKSKDLDRIPYAVRTSSRETILSFFCGLIDTDGCVREGGSLSIDSTSEKFLRNLQQIAEAVGLSFSLFHNTEGENLQGQKDMHGLCLSRMISDPSAIEYLNQNSVKCSSRPVLMPKREFKFEPYKIVSVECDSIPDYSYDFAVDGIDDNDSWYWQGALKSHNTKSLLTGASPGWHPPKAAYFIRRITFGKNDPVALACINYGYNVIPSQSDKDENGKLLDDPFDPRVTEWLVEIPMKTRWADLDVEKIDISKFSALAQFDFYMQVQQYYTTHNTSATIEIRESEIEEYSKAVYDAIQLDNGYISVALLARYDDNQTYPRLPFEPISREKYERQIKLVEQRRKYGMGVGDEEEFRKAIEFYSSQQSSPIIEEMAGPAGCDSDKCLMPEKK